MVRVSKIIESMASKENLLDSQEILNAARSWLVKSLLKGDIKDLEQMLELKLLDDRVLRTDEVISAARLGLVKVLSSGDGDSAKFILNLKILEGDNLKSAEIVDAAKAGLLQSLSHGWLEDGRGAIPLELIPVEDLRSSQIVGEVKTALIRLLSKGRGYEAGFLFDLRLASELKSAEVVDAAKVGFIQSLSDGSFENARNILALKLIPDDVLKSKDVVDAAKAGLVQVLGHLDIEAIRNVLDMKLLDRTALESNVIQEAIKAAAVENLSGGRRDLLTALLKIEIFRELAAQSDEIVAAVKAALIKGFERTKSDEQIGLGQIHELIDLKLLKESELNSLVRLWTYTSPLQELFGNDVLAGVSSVELGIRLNSGYYQAKMLFHDDPELMQTIQRRIAQKDNFKAMAAFLQAQKNKDSFEAAKKMCESLIKDETKSSVFKLSSSNFSELLAFKEYFKSDPDTLARIENDIPTDYWLGIKNFIQENPDTNSVLIKELLMAQVDLKMLKGARLSILSSLIGYLDKNSPEMMHLLELEKSGLNLADVYDFIRKDPKENLVDLRATLGLKGSIEQVRKLLENSADINTFFLKFEPDVAETLERMVEDGLKMERLVNYTKTDSDNRIKVLSEIIKGGSSASRINDIVRLEMLPIEVANSILANNNFKVTELLRYLNDWNIGPHFAQALIESLRNGHSIVSLERLVEQAHVMANRGAESISLANTKFDKSEPLFKQAASMLTESTRAILEKIPPEKNIVIIGRDAMPLVPLLASQGRKVQYFLFSRLQIDDASTRAQWLKEVPPGSVVIDTGYAGSILDSIKDIDKTVSPQLLSSRGKYPQILESVDHGELVRVIEYFPKIINRSNRFTANNGAVSRRASAIDIDDMQGGNLNTSYIQNMTFRMLKETGLSDWQAWRYSWFTGLTAKERLRMTDDEVRSHFERVKAEREKLEPQR
ncbi:MAG: hypothetical protein IPG59_16265 [Candidatus Melainabacteria bacterium]|nr:MAG: hypothetical protein IPG59_16265 [Candidatus Melainabacteria bacterium]